MKQITVTAQNVELAIEDGLKQLNVTEDKVDIRVIDKGQKGFMGIGSRLAIVKLSLKQESILEQLSVFNVEPDLEKVEDSPEAEEVLPQTVVEEVSQVKNVAVELIEEEVVEPVSEIDPSQTVEINHSEVIKAVSAYLEQMFEDMGIEIAVSHEVDGKICIFNLSGEKIALLIGKRGQVLNSLQYLAQLVANSHSKHYVTVRLDAEEYRSRRNESLEGLARKMAYKVKKTRKEVSLEPMPSYERKVIHAAISDISGIKTFSKGTEPNRYLVIAPDYY